MRHCELGAMALAGTLAALPVHAQATDPAPGMAHISALKGKVLVSRGGGAGQVPATLNTPLSSGDVITTEAGARADIQLDSVHALRLAESGQIRVERAEYERYQIALDKGAMVYEVNGDSPAIAAVDTPSVSAAPSRPGVYRFRIERGGQSEIRAEAGEILAYAATGSVWVGAGQRLLARGPAANPEFRLLRRRALWARLGPLARIFGNMQIGGGGSVESDSGSGGKAAKKSETGDSGKSAARATPHPSHAPGTAAKSESGRAGGATHGGGGSHGGGSSSSSSSHSGGGSHASSSSSSSHSDSGSHSSSSSSSGSSSSHGK